MLDADRLTFGSMILMHRLAHGMSQKKLAEAVGVTQGSVTAWENNRYLPEWKTVAKVVTYLGLDLDLVVNAIGNNILESFKDLADGSGPATVHRADAPHPEGNVTL